MPKIAGYGVAIDRETGKTVDEHETSRCVHCGGHFRIVPGSGRTRGYCFLCDGVTCGSRECLEHYPFQKRLEDYESGKLIILR